MADARIPASKWHGDKPDPIQRKRTPNRRRQLYWLTALLLAILGTVAAMILYPRSMIPPRFLAMPVREYPAALLPPNAWVYQDSQLLIQHFEKKVKAYDKQNLDEFKSFLAQIESGDEPMVVYLGALARVDNDGKVYVYLSDMNPDDPNRDMPLDTVLKSMAKGKQVGLRLLLLDLARPAADVRLGILANNVADAVHTQLAGTEWPFFVMTASAPGQLSQVSEEIGNSAFARYLDLGLAGFADADRNQQVTTQELFNFVRKQVDRWAWVNRGQRQEPRLYGKASDFAVKQLTNDSPTLPEMPKETSYPAWLKNGWKERDILFGDGSYRRAPWSFRQLEIALANTEKRWRSGANDSDGLAKELALHLANRKEEIVAARDMAARARYSLAEVKLSEVKDDKTEAAAKDLQFKLDRYLEKVADENVKDELDKVRAKEVKEVKAQLIEQVKALKPFEARAALIMATAYRCESLTDARIGALVELLHEVRPPLEAPAFAETIYLERLRDLAEVTRGNVEWPAPTAKLALRGAVETEDLLAELGRTPSGFAPWNKELLTRSENDRRNGDKHLFHSDTSTWQEAPDAYRNASQTRGPIERRLKILRLVEEGRDRAFVDLPGWAPFFIALPRVDLPEEDAWRQGVQAAGELADLLQRKDIGALDDVPAALNRWQDSLRQWQKSIGERIKRLDEVAEIKVADYLEWSALLENARFTAEQREAIWKSVHKVGRKLLELMPPPTMSDVEVASKGIEPGFDPAARQEKEREDRRRRVAKDFLDIAAYQWPEAPDKAGPKEANDARENRFAPDQLKKTLVKGVLQQFHAELKGAAKSNETDDAKKELDRRSERLAKADRISRIFPDVISLRAAGAENRNPVLTLQRINQLAFLSFLRERYQREATELRMQKSRHEDFYATAAEAYGVAVEALVRQLPP